jgi:hypothetical protein
MKTLCLFLLSSIAVFAQSQACFNATGGSTYPCSTAPQPSIVQKHPQASSGSVASLANAFGSNTVKGNSIIVVTGIGNGTTPTSVPTDTGSNVYKLATNGCTANSTTFEVCIYYATNIAGGANTVTVNNTGATASIASEVYEVAGLITASATAAIDQSTGATSGSSGTSPATSMTPLGPNQFSFVGFGLGTAAQTITVSGNYSNDSGQLNPTTPAGLFSFVSASLYKAEMATTSPSATASAEPWAVAAATFKTVILPVMGTMQGQGTAGVPSGGVISVQGVSGGQAETVAQATAANLNATVVGAGSAGAASGGVVTVQGVASMTKLLVTPDANVGVNAQPTPVTSGGLSTFVLEPAASDNHTNIKNGAGQVYHIEAFNNSATLNYLRLYNAGTGFNGCNSATNLVWETNIPASATGAGFVADISQGLAFSTGISICVTGAYGQTSTTSATATAMSVNIGYK